MRKDQGEFSLRNIRFSLPVGYSDGNVQDSSEA